MTRRCKASAMRCLSFVRSVAMAGMLMLVLLITGCGESGSEDPVPNGSPTFGTGNAIIETAKGSVLLKVEVAEKPEQRARGLMFRESLPQDYGMVFFFFEDTQAVFYMKDTLVPLSIAFFDADGKILKILDMEPCEEDPCQTYNPGVTYRGALEVEQGSFEKWGVMEGDEITVSR